MTLYYLPEVYEFDPVAFYVWMGYYGFKFLIAIPIELYLTYKFIKMRHIDIIRKRNFVGWLIVLICAFAFGNRIEPLNVQYNPSWCLILGTP